MSPALNSLAVPAPALDGVTVPWERVERFVGQVSHDIRNGLNACELQLTYLGELVSDPEVAQEIKSLRGTLAGMTKHLQTLRSATTATTPNLLEYPAADLFEDLRDRFARLRPELVARMRWKMNVENQILVHIDPELVLGSCLELLDNAFQFADKNTAMTCTLSVDGKVVIRVEEALGEAPATPPANWGQSPLVSTRRGSYGLGLFRARRALAAQGASLDFHYSPEKKTLTATMTLPGAPAPALP